MEVFVVEFMRLVEIFLLHLVSDLAVFAVRGGFGEEKLVDDDVVSIDFVRCEFLNETLRLVEGEEL